jgi:pyrimidine operon attenuation protein/uracil phosphoribosyltransferase
MTEPIHRDAAWMQATLERLAQDCLAVLPAGDDPVAVIGIRTRGPAVAERLAHRFREAGRACEVGHIDVTLYRDDLNGAGGRKAMKASDIPFDLTGRTVLLVDDVFSTGRTTRAALTELMDFGRPAVVRLATLLDRGGRELPIRPDVVGETLEAAPDRKVQVRMAEFDGVDEVEVV